jgi:hypothetical protein
VAIYQAPRKRWRIALAAGLAGVVAGLGLGLAIGGGDADPIDVLRTLDAQLEDAAAPLDVLAIHGEVDAPSSKDARVATDALRLVRRRFEPVRPAVRMIDRDAEREVDEHLATLQQLVRERADPTDVARQADALADLLRGIVRA